MLDNLPAVLPGTPETVPPIRTRPQLQEFSEGDIASSPEPEDPADKSYKGKVTESKGKLGGGNLPRKRTRATGPPEPLPVPLGHESAETNKLHIDCEPYAKNTLEFWMSDKSKAGA